MVLFRTLFRGRGRSRKRRNLQSAQVVYPPARRVSASPVPVRKATLMPYRPSIVPGASVSARSSRIKFPRSSSVIEDAVIVPAKRRSALTKTGVRTIAATAGLARIGRSTSATGATMMNSPNPAWATWGVSDDYAVLEDYAAASASAAPAAAKSQSALATPAGDEIRLYKRRCAPRPSDAERVRNFQMGYRAPKKRFIPWC